MESGQVHGWLSPAPPSADCTVRLGRSNCQRVDSGGLMGPMIRMIRAEMPLSQVIALSDCD